MLLRTFLQKLFPAALLLAMQCALLAFVGCAADDRPTSTASKRAVASTSPAPATQAAASEHMGHGTSRPSTPDEGVVSMDVYTTGSTIHLLIARRSAGGPPFLEYLRSSDAGKTWSDAVPVGAGQPIPDPVHRGMDAQIAASGQNVVAAWTTPGALDKFGRGPIATAISHDGGKTWHAGPNPSDDGLATGHAFIDLAVTDDGVFHIVWLDGRDRTPKVPATTTTNAGMGGKGLRYARSIDGGQTWSTNQTLDPQTCECCWNTLATAPGGHVGVLYRNFAPRDMAIVSSSDAGLTWSKTPTTVGAFGWDVNGCPHVGGGLCFRQSATGLGACAVVWTAKGNGATGSFVLNSPDAGSTWSGPAQFGADPKSWHADIASAPNGVIASVWDAYTDAGQAVFSATSSDGGKTWSDPLRISDPTTSATHPKIVRTGDNFRAFWTAKTKAGGASQWQSKAIGSTAN